MNIFIWRLCQGRIPTRTTLDMMDIDLDSLLCPHCNDTVESVEHCIISCKWAQKGWIDLFKWLFKWWNMGQVNGGSIRDIIMHEGRNNFNSHKKELLETAIWSMAYIIWSIRNKVVFENKKAIYIDLCAEVQVRSFFWIRHRVKKLNISWSSWCSNLETCS